MTPKCTYIHPCGYIHAVHACMPPVLMGGWLRGRLQVAAQLYRYVQWWWPTLRLAITNSPTHRFTSCTSTKTILYHKLKSLKVETTTCITSTGKEHENGKWCGPWIAMVALPMICFLPWYNYSHTKYIDPVLINIDQIYEASSKILWYEYVKSTHANYGHQESFGYIFVVYPIQIQLLHPIYWNDVICVVLASTMG